MVQNLQTGYFNQYNLSSLWHRHGVFPLHWPKIHKLRKLFQEFFQNFSSFADYFCLIFPVMHLIVQVCPPVCKYVFGTQYLTPWLLNAKDAECE